MMCVQHCVILTIWLYSCIKAFPPSGPSRHHNWVMLTKDDSSPLLAGGKLPDDGQCVLTAEVTLS